MASNDWAALVVFREQVVVIDYVNWRGERRVRRIIPGKILYGSTEWHPKRQWLLEAYDLDRGEPRTFAMSDILSWKGPTAPTKERK